MPHSRTTTSSSIEAPPAPDFQTNPTSESSTRSQKRSSRMRSSFQRTQSRTDEWSQGPDGGSSFSLVGWFRSLRSKRKEGKMDDLETRNSGVGLRSQSPPRLPELGLDSTRLELLAEETGFSEVGPDRQH
ncbi:uncharacterized protein N7484_008992 [Penicillium longicatenatum]|uniref:uncharacterized protein n=1 Tax=Penicillium longicatenatum TaxID=1561947 RepID=UPI002546786D|nr:uncharacterized protein N7484_008992 [Penicillium longicatenatum]KAJ5635679.1 hypothetical protein N7484_008992 [Penicillium longicatenatum]